MAEITEKDVLKKRGDLEREIDNHKKRFFEATLPDGGVHTFDLKTPPPKIDFWVKKLGIDKAQRDAAMEQKRLYITPLMTQKSQTTILLRSVSKKNGDQTTLDLNSGLVYDLMGRFSTPEDVVETLKMQGFYVKTDEVRSWVAEHNDNIKLKQAQFLLEHGRESIRVGTEAGRLQIINSQVHYWESRFKLDPTENITKLMLQLLKAAKDEVKGEVITVQGGLTIDVNATYRAKSSVNHIFSEIPINSLIIGMVAAQQGINPLALMGSLSHSYYSKMNGFNNPITGNEEVTLPSTIIKSYDWGMIEQMNSEKKRFEPISEVEVIEDKVHEAEVIATKEDLLARIRNFNKNKVSEQYIKDVESGEGAKGKTRPKATPKATRPKRGKKPKVSKKNKPTKNE